MNSGNLLLQTPLVIEACLIPWGMEGTGVRSGSLGGRGDPKLQLTRVMSYHFNRNDCDSDLSKDKATEYIIYCRW